MLMRYFYALIGEDLNIYGSNEFNQPQDDSLLFFNTIGKNYQLGSRGYNSDYNYWIESI